MLLTIVPLAIAQLVTLFAVMNTVESDVEDRARASLVTGGLVVNEFLASRGEQLRTSVAVLSADFGLKEATATGDENTIRSVLENHGRRVRADMAMLVDLDGNTVASTLDIASRRLPSVTRLLRELGDRGVESTAVIDNVAYHVFAVPLRAPVTVGWVFLGFRIDNAVADRISSLTGLDVSIISVQAEGTKIIASTAGGFAPGEATTALHASGTLNNEVFTAQRADEQLLALRTPFVAGSSDVAIVLDRSLRVAMQPYVEARSGLVIFGAALLTLVAIAAVLFAATISQPLRTLAAAAQRMISGNYGEDVAVNAKDEFGELASSFNAMRTAISEREQRITYQASHDSLTDLPNRYRIVQLLTAEIEAARRHDLCITVMSIRLPDIGKIASTLGHKAGDQLTRVAAKQLAMNISEGDVLGHIGTDEFVLILCGQDVASGHSYVDKVERILSAGVSLENFDVELRANIGIAAFPAHSHNAAELLRFAAIARTDAKNSKETARVYEVGREEEFVHRLRVVNDLRSAIRNGELDVWLQPKVSLPEGTVCGVEALVRWQHPELGFMPPDDFVPAAEKAGTIVHLSRYVLERAVMYCRRLAEQGHELSISVNLSVRDLLDEYLPYHVLQILKDHDVQPRQLTLEVTEGSIMEDVGHAVLVLECLRDIGVRISMDDFGTGHSSLSQLRNIPLHELKIDRSFVMSLASDATNESIVRTTISLAQDLELSVVAEGVEDEATMRRISELGCQQAQGFFLSKPLPYDGLVSWLESFKVVRYAERRKSKRAFSARR